MKDKRYISVVDVGMDDSGKLGSKVTMPMIKSANDADMIRDYCFSVS